MNLEQYAAHQAQEPQEAQGIPQPLEVLAARLDAEKLHALQAEAQEAIDSQAAPAAILERITGALFGADSPQAAAVEAIIEADRRPGGRELALTWISDQRRLLQRAARQLEQQARAITGELETLEAAERDLRREGTRAAALDQSLLDVLTFAKQFGAEGPGTDFIEAATALCDKHHGNPAAMGLLYGCIVELNRKQYSAAAFDLVQQQAFKDLAARIVGTISL